MIDRLCQLWRADPLRGSARLVRVVGLVARIILHAAENETFGLMVMLGRLAATNRPWPYLRCSNSKADSRKRLKVTPAVKTPASPRPPEEAAIDGPSETAPTAPGGAARCRLRLVPSPTAGRCYVSSGGNVDGAPGVFAAGGRAVSRPPPERICQRRAANVGGARRRLGMSRTFPPATSWAAP